MCRSAPGGHTGGVVEIEDVGIRDETPRTEAPAPFWRPSDRFFRTQAVLFVVLGVLKLSAAVWSDSGGWDLLSGPLCFVGAAAFAYEARRRARR